MCGIFVSYRREDSAPYAGRLYDRLRARFGDNQVFMDVDDIPPGADFAARIDAKVAACDAMVVVIGKNWLSARDAGGRLRLDAPNDPVAMEVALALRRHILVVPVLVGKAEMPKASELRGDLKPLAQRNALAVSDEEFSRDVDQLIRTFEAVPTLRSKSARDARVERRRKLWRRLAWKAPLIVLLVSFAVWWQWRKEEALKPVLRPQAPAPGAAAIAGYWSAEVSYSWGEKFTEQFFFVPEGAKLFGTASFLGVKRGIEEGRIDGEKIAFLVRFQESAGDLTADHKNYYWGVLDGEQILMRLQDDRGNPPLDFVLRNSG